MHTKAPPSTALRAFEAAARHLSFTDAGQELHITQGAVSRQIRLLEDYLGQQLFVRFTRRIELTAVGRDYYLEVQKALRDLDRATQRVMRSASRSVLSINVLPSLATSWLMPRLASFVEQYPHLDVQLSTSTDPIDLHRSGVDVALRVGRVPGDSYPESSPRVDSDITANWNGVRTDYFAPDIMVPVMSPQLLARLGRNVTTPADLLHFPLLHTGSRKLAWDHWLKASGLSVPPGERTLLGHFFMAARAAESGRGIAILPTILVPRETLGHTLVAPLKASLHSAGAYYLGYLEARAQEPAIRAFRTWLLHESQQLRAPDTVLGPSMHTAAENGLTETRSTAQRQ